MSGSRSELSRRDAGSICERASLRGGRYAKKRNGSVIDVDQVVTKYFPDVVVDPAGNVVLPIGPEAVGCDVGVTVDVRRRMSQEAWVALINRTAGGIDDRTFMRPPQCGCEELSRKSRVELDGDPRPFRVTVEPWAVDFDVRPGDRCAVVAEHPEFAPALSVGPCPGGSVVTVQNSRSTFVFVRNNVVEFAVPESLAIPNLTFGREIA